MGGSGQVAILWSYTELELLAASLDPSNRRVFVLCSYKGTIKGGQSASLIV